MTQLLEKAFAEASNLTEAKQEALATIILQELVAELHWDGGLANYKIPSGRIVKLGGLLAKYNMDITEKDISQARQEMWHNFGEPNE